MKTIVIGDIHGADVWKKIVHREKPDKTIFLGDYLDSFDISTSQQLANFLDLVEYKRANPDSVVLLIGNHDYHYTSIASERYSGFQIGLYYQVQPLIDQMVRGRELQAAHSQGRFLFSHAGLTKTWAQLAGIDIEKTDIAGSINDVLFYQGRLFRFMGGDYYGEDITQSPIWVRPKSLKEDMVPDYTHVVGHTYQKTLQIGENIIFIDTLPNGQYLIIEDNVPRIGTI